MTMGRTHLGSSIEDMDMSMMGVILVNRHSPAPKAPGFQGLRYGVAGECAFVGEPFGGSLWGF